MKLRELGKWAMDHQLEISIAAGIVAGLINFDKIGRQPTLIPFEWKDVIMEMAIAALYITQRAFNMHTASLTLPQDRRPALTTTSPRKNLGPVSKDAVLLTLGLVFPPLGAGMFMGMFTQNFFIVQKLPRTNQ